MLFSIDQKMECEGQFEAGWLRDNISHTINERVQMLNDVYGEEFVPSEDKSLYPNFIFTMKSSIFEMGLNFKYWNCQFI